MERGAPQELDTTHPQDFAARRPKLERHPDAAADPEVIAICPRKGLTTLTAALTSSVMSSEAWLGREDLRMAESSLALSVRDDRRAGRVHGFHDADLLASEHAGRGTRTIQFRRFREGRCAVQYGCCNCERAARPNIPSIPLERDFRKTGLHFSGSCSSSIIRILDEFFVGPTPSVPAPPYRSPNQTARDRSPRENDLPKVPGTSPRRSRL